MDNITDSFKFKTKLSGQTGDNGIKDVKIAVPLKYLSNFKRTLDMPIDAAPNQATTFMQ